MLGFRSNSSRQRVVRLSVLGLALAIWFQACQCDSGIGALALIKVPVRNVGSGSGEIDIPATTNESFCPLGPASTPSQAGCKISFEDAGAGGNFQLNPTAKAGSVFVRWVDGPCVGLPTGCSLLFPQTGDYTFAEVTVEFAGPPTLSTIFPNSATSGAVQVVVPVTLTGTDFLTGTSVSVTGGIGTGNVVVVSPTELRVPLTIPAGTSGVKKVSVATQAGTSNEIDFAVSVPPPPTLDSIRPNTGVSGSPSFDVTFYGTHFDATTIANPSTTTSPGAIQFSNPRVISPTRLIATVTIPANTSPGAQPVSVTTQFGTSGSLPFQVAAPPPVPVLSIVDPNSGAQGQNVAVRLLGTNFDPTTNAVTVSGTGIVVSGLTTSSTGEVRATFQIGATAPLGSRNVSVIAGGAASNPLPFTVVAPAASLTLTSVSPSSGAFAQVVNVTIVGTGFVQGVSLNLAGVSITNFVIIDSAHLTATFTISSQGSVGARALTASIGSVVSNPITFTVTCVDCGG